MFDPFCKGQEFFGFLLMDFYSHRTELRCGRTVIAVPIRTMNWPYLSLLHDRFAPVAAQKSRSMTESWLAEWRSLGDSELSTHVGL